MNKDGKIGGIVNGILILRSAIYFLISTAISVVIFALILFFTESGSEYTPIFGTVSVAIGILITSFITAKKLAKKGFMVGLVTAGVVFMLTTLISLIIDDGGFTLNTIFHLIIYLLSGLIGGILGVNKSSNNKFF